MITTHDELPALPTERGLLFFYRGTGRAAGTPAHRACVGWIERSETHQWALGNVPMGFGYRLYRSYNDQDGNDRWMDRKIWVIG